MTSQAQPAALPQEFLDKLREIDGDAQALQRKMVAVAAEAKLEAGGTQPLTDTLERKAAQLGHIRRSFSEVPAKLRASAAEVPQ